MYIYTRASLIALLVKSLPAMQETPVQVWVKKICWRRDRLPTPVFLGFPCGSAGKESACNAGRPGFDPWVGKIPWGKERLSTPLFWPREFHGLYSPWGRKELDLTERFWHTVGLSQMQETQETQVWSLGGDDPPEEGRATRSSTLVWEIPWTEESDGLQSTELQRVGQD